MSTSVYGVAALNPATGYPVFGEPHHLDRIPVDYFVGSSVGFYLENFLSQPHKGWTVAEVQDRDLMVGECVCIAMLPDVLAVSSCTWESSIPLSDTRELCTKTKTSIASASAVEVLLQQPNGLKYELCQWIETYGAVLASSGGIVLVGVDSNEFDFSMNSCAALDDPARFSK